MSKTTAFKMCIFLAGSTLFTVLTGIANAQDDAGSRIESAAQQIGVQGEGQGEGQAEELSAEQIAAESLNLNLREFIRSWAGAWQSQLTDAYFTHYHQDFVPANGMNMAAWRQDRIKRILAPESIQISLREFELIANNGNEVTVRFWLSYSRPNYADRTWKRMRLRSRNGLWQILSEENLQVEVR